MSSKIVLLNFPHDTYYGFKNDNSKHNIREYKRLISYHVFTYNIEKGIHIQNNSALTILLKK